MSTRKRKSAHLPIVQEQLNQIIEPHVHIVLDHRQIDIVTRYRRAKDALSKAINTAVINAEARGGSGYSWSSEDRAICDAAEDQFGQCQIEMCTMLDVAALVAGVS